LIVLHSAEGALTIESLGGYFAQGSVQASSHVGIDDKVNTIGEFVKRDKKAWTQAAYNPIGVSVELCAFANWDTAEWMRHSNMLDNVAKWIAEESAAFGIPIVKLGWYDAQNGGRGVCYHSDLGAAGGGHSDPGPGFPIDYVLTMATGATQIKQEVSLITSARSNNGVLHVFELHDEVIWYTYQPHGTLGWHGKPLSGGLAGMHKFADAKGVTSIAAGLAEDGTLHLFATKLDGSVVFTYQKPGSSHWSGGSTGVGIAKLQSFAPAP
jgi:hypothetical protein